MKTFNPTRDRRLRTLANALAHNWAFYLGVRVVPILLIIYVSWRFS